MKILVISNYRDSLNSVRPEAELWIGLQHLGYAITIMTHADGAYLPKFVEAGIQIIPFHPKKKISWKAIRFIRKEIKQNRYDLLLLLNSKAISNGNFASIGLPIKVLVYRGVIGGSSWLNPNSYLKHLHPRVDGILAVSKSVQAYLQKQIWWNPRKVKQFYKGQRLDWYKDSQPINRQELGIPPDAFIITCIANNRKWKGVNFLLEATHHLPPTLPFHFLLIGRKMDTTENLKLIRTSPYKNQILILGHRKDVCEILAATQVYVQPSLKDKEGLGKAILEAMSLGVPPIVTNSGGPKEYVKDGVSGMVIPPKDAKAIAHKILALYENEQLRKEMGQSAKLVIEGPLNMETSISKIDQIFKNKTHHE